MIIVKGFSKQKLVQIEQIQSFIKLIPQGHLKGITTIVYDPARYYQRSYANPAPINYRVAGEFNSVPLDYIAIYKFVNAEQLQHILYHEVGHHVFKNQLNAAQRKQWVTQLFPNSNYVSDYAKTNASEDFAESYAFFIKKNAIIERSSKKLIFLNKTLS